MPRDGAITFADLIRQAARSCAWSADRQSARAAVPGTGGI
jgi:hypothetical protein